MTVIDFEKIKARKAALNQAICIAIAELNQQYTDKKFTKKDLEKGMTQIKRWGADQHARLYAQI